MEVVPCMSAGSGAENILFDITLIIWEGGTFTLPNPTPIIITIILNNIENIILNFNFIDIYPDI
jgi:hypothetical protein